jgi:hypothetical protein
MKMMMKRERGEGDAIRGTYIYPYIPGILTQIPKM